MKASLAHKMKKPEVGDVDYEKRVGSWIDCDELDKLSSLLRGNTGIIFSNGDLPEIKKVLDKEKREAPAKVGALAPDDVWIKAGSTGLDPKQTSFFQTLSIQTKIIKTQIEIVTDKKIISAGTRIEATHAALLDKLKIRPFSYQMGVKKVYDNGQVFDASVLDITPETILAGFQQAINNLAAASLASGFVTKAAMPHILASSFKNLVAVSFETDYSFKQADSMKNAAKNAVAAAPAQGAAKKEEKVEVVEEEEADVDTGNLFTDDY
jgi:large subunit ribosomal protein LP0